MAALTIGLTIARHVVELHGDTLSASSAGLTPVQRLRFSFRQRGSRGQAAMTDRECALSDSLREDSREALGLMYDQHAPLVYSVACRILANAPEAEDVVQDVFLQVWRGAAAYDPDRGSVQNWLVMIARTRALDRLRRRDVRARYIESRNDVDHLPGHWRQTGDESLTSSECSRLLRCRLDTLPAGLRLPLELALYQGFTHTEIAEILNMRLGTVKSRLRAALQRVRQSPVGAPSRPAEPSPFTEALCDYLAANRTCRKRLTGRRVLVIDNDAGTTDLLRLIFGSAGAIVSSAASCFEGEDRLQDNWPDVVVTDILMPGEDGFAMLRKASAFARGVQRKLCAIALTALPRTHHEAILRAGFDVCLAKPIQPRALIEAAAGIV
jgi:RNA polymerase sigma-70 factor (ECF subfamily)